MHKMSACIRRCLLVSIIIILLSLPCIAVPGLNLTKTCNTISANLGDTITYNFVLLNNGTEPLSNPALLDDHLGAIRINQSILEVGKSYPVSISYRINESDLPGPLVNFARATARYKGSDISSNNASFAVSLGVAGYENLTKYGYSGFNASFNGA